MISIKQAREILSKTGEEMSDSEVESLINNLYALINNLLDNNLTNTKNGKSNNLLQSVIAKTS